MDEPLKGKMIVEIPVAPEIDRHQKIGQVFDICFADPEINFVKFQRPRKAPVKRTGDEA